MIEKLSLILLLFCSLMLITVIVLIKKDLLKTQHALLFIFLTIPLIPLSLSKNLQVSISQSLGIYYAPNAFFLAGFVFLLVLSLYFLVAVSQLFTQNKKLARSIALLRAKLDSLET